MADQPVIVSIPNQITGTTPIIIVSDLIITHPENAEECYTLNVNTIELIKDQSLRITAKGSDFKIDLKEYIFDPGGEKTIMKDISVIVKVIKEFKGGVAIPIECAICKKPYSSNIEAQKKIIVKYAGETIGRVLKEIITRNRFLEDVTTIPL